MAKVRYLNKSKTVWVGPDGVYGFANSKIRDVWLGNREATMRRYLERQDRDNKYAEKEAQREREAMMSRLGLCDPVYQKCALFLSGFTKRDPPTDGRQFVYFIQGELTRLIKIGYTRDAPLVRLANCQMGSPDALHLLLYLPGTHKSEQALHMIFSAARVRGEWFSETPELLQLIAAGLELKMEITTCPPLPD